MRETAAAEAQAVEDRQRLDLLYAEKRRKANAHPSGFSDKGLLQWTVSGFDEDVTDVFFGLSPLELKIFYLGCEEAYGKGPADYARRTYESWKTGEVTYAAVSIRKFLELVPEVLDHDHRYDLLKKLYQRTREVEYFEITVVLGHSEHLFQALDQKFAILCQKPRAHRLSQEVLNLMAWVCRRDATQARRMMATIEQEESTRIVQMAKIEHEEIKAAFRRMDASYVGSHEIRLPYGVIVVNIRKPTWIDTIARAFK